MTLFASDARLQAFIAQITQTSVNIVSQQIMEEFQISVNQLLNGIGQTFATRMTSVRDTVIQQITAMTAGAAVSTVTGYQTLGNAGPGFCIPSTPITIPHDGPVVPPIHDPSCPRLYPNQPPVILNGADLSKAKWIWTKEVAQNSTPDRSVRPFRKTISLKCPVNYATIDIACDNFYTVYVNGRVVGSGKEWNKPDRYTVRFESTTKVVIAVYAAQDPVLKAQVGLIVSGKVWNSQEQNPQAIEFVSDVSWKTVSTDRFSFEFVRTDYNDSNWEQSYVQAVYGQGVWRPIAPVTDGRMPRTRLTNTTGVDDAPKAGEADVVPNPGVKA